MTEREWVSSIIEELEIQLRKTSKQISVVCGHRLSYSREIQDYTLENTPNEQISATYETDILIRESFEDFTWKPRIVIEAKLGRVTTHDAITYSQKAQAHKFVHPYLRYGILLGNIDVAPLPGRLFRHGLHFDFMLSWKSSKASSSERKGTIEVLNAEIEASRSLEKMLYNSRQRNRDKFTILHRPLILK